MDLGSESSEDEDVEEFRYDMDIDEQKWVIIIYTVFHKKNRFIFDLTLAFLVRSS